MGNVWELSENQVREKRQFGLSIAGLIQAGGEVFYKNIFLNQANKADKRKLKQKIQIVFQDPYNSLNPRMTVGDIVSEGLLVHYRLSDAERNRRVRGCVKRSWIG